MKKIALEGADACPYCRASLPYAPRSSLDLPPGQVLQGRYIIGRLLGRGGFGATYIAFDTAAQERCAVKEYFPSQMVTRERGQTDVSLLMKKEFEFYKKRFFTEANQLRDLAHVEGLARLYDVFSENQTAYFVMEYIPGSNLKQYLRDFPGGVPQTKALDILRQLLAILASVHSSGVLHRDISLDNICLTEEGRVKLIDFGAARSSVLSSMTKFTKGVYTAPEQAMGREQGSFTDLYAVGVVMFELFMGRLPKVQDGNLEPLAGDAKSPLLALDQVYMKATRTQPAQRYQFAQDMLTDLERVGQISQQDWDKARKRQAGGEGKGRPFFLRRKAGSQPFKVSVRPKSMKRSAVSVSRSRQSRPPGTDRGQAVLVAVLIILSVLFLLLFAVIVLS